LQVGGEEIGSSWNKKPEVIHLWVQSLTDCFLLGFFIFACLEFDVENEEEYANEFSEEHCSSLHERMVKF